MYTPQYPLTVTVSLQHYYSFLHSGDGKMLGAHVRASIAERFYQLDPSLDKEYVRGIVMAAWYTMAVERKRPANLKVVIQQPTDPFPELSREFLVGFVSQVFSKINLPQ